MEFGYTEIEQEAVTIQPSLQTQAHNIPGNSLAMSVDEASPSNNTLLINNYCVRL